MRLEYSQLTEGKKKTQKKDILLFFSFFFLPPICFVRQCKKKNLEPKHYLDGNLKKNKWIDFSEICQMTPCGTKEMLSYTRCFHTKPFFYISDFFHQLRKEPLSSTDRKST